MLWSLKALRGFPDAGTTGGTGTYTSGRPFDGETSATDLMRLGQNASMAFITKFFKVPVAAGRRHSDCECGWSVTQRDGSVVLQLDTYGSRDRKLAQKVSQSVQLDREGALELLRIIETAFPKP